MAGKLNKKKLGDGFDLPPPVITEANRDMMEASGRAEGRGKRGEMVLVARGPQQRGQGGSFPHGLDHVTERTHVAGRYPTYRVAAGCTCQALGHLFLLLILYPALKVG
jgi:hypothetical protein